MDLTKLTPKQAGSVPWRHSQMNLTDWEFYTLARNWLDIQIRRKWYVWHEQGFGWWLEDDHDKTPRFEPRRFATVLEAWQAAVEYDAIMEAEAITKGRR